MNDVLIETMTGMRMMMIGMIRTEIVTGIVTTGIIVTIVTIGTTETIGTIGMIIIMGES